MVQYLDALILKLEKNEKIISALSESNQVTCQRLWLDVILSHHMSRTAKITQPRPKIKKATGAEQKGLRGVV